MIVKALAFAFLLSVVGVFAEEASLLNVLVDQCKTFGAEDKVPVIRTTLENYQQCMLGLNYVHKIHSTTIENVNATEKAVEIFTELCNKKQEIISCYYDLVQGLAPCLGKTAQDHINSTKQGIRDMFNHMCHSLPEFIAEKGFECSIANRISLGDCISGDTIGSSPFNLVATNAKEKCAKFDQAIKCMSDQLNTCSLKVKKIFETFFQDFKTIIYCTSANAPSSTVTSLPLVW